MPPLEIPFGSVRFGDLRRSLPIGRDFGVDRGTPVARYYVESFIARHANDIHGRVLEVADNDYTRRFGGARVDRSDVISREARPNTTIAGDLAQPGTLPEAAFDCIIFTQTLQYIYDARAGVAMLYRALKPNGVLLATVPAIAPMGDRPGHPDKPDVWPWYWTFTPAALRRLLEDQFGQNAVAVQAHGNVFLAAAFLYGLAIEELDLSELNVDDPRYPILVAARAIKRTDSKMAS